MRTIAVKPLTMGDFSPYGSFHDMLHPSGPSFGDDKSQFYRDALRAPLGGKMLAASPLHILKRDFIVETTEMHSYTAECLVCLDGDIIIHVGPASVNGKVPLNEFEAFYVPKGTAVTILPGVWHYCPYAVNDAEVNVLILLPVRTYANDCLVYELPEDDRIKITK